MYFMVGPRYLQLSREMESCSHPSDMLVTINSTCLSSVIVRVSVVLKRTVGDSD